MYTHDRLLALPSRFRRLPNSLWSRTWADGPCSKAWDTPAVRDTKPSASAQAVALARAHLHWIGVIDDPWAEDFLTPRYRRLALVLRRRPFTRYGRGPSFSFLAARTQFFDDVVTGAADDGVRQVVIVGAGYDSRARRLARPSLGFFEVDHPATQAHKRRMAPAHDAAYIPVDLASDSVSEALDTAGLDTAQPTVFVVEGLTMYLDETQVEGVFGELAKLAPTGSQLAANFTGRGGGAVSPLSRIAARAIRTAWRVRGEPTRYWATPEKVTALLFRAGWEPTEILNGPEVVSRHLRGTAMATTGVNTEVSCVSARRRPADT